MILSVENAALIMSTQDLGRFKYQRFGMPVSGPMDWWAFRSANKLVGNLPESACVEMGFTSAKLRMGGDSLMAACGCGYRLFRNKRELPLWMAFVARRGDQLDFVKSSEGNWVYLAASGGINSPVWMGSRSVYPRAGLGQLLTNGAQLSFVPLKTIDPEMAGVLIPSNDRPKYSNDPVIRVIPGPHFERFTSKSTTEFWEKPFKLSPRMDRMGYRLSGTILSHKNGADIISQGLVLGQVQVPADGHPIVMMPDHPTTGGYTSIGTVILSDLPLLAQAEPGRSIIHFASTTVADAQHSLENAYKKIYKAVDNEEEPWLHI